MSLYFFIFNFLNNLSSPKIKSIISHGSHKVKYQPDSDWDFQLVGGQLPIDLNLLLPHYRARNQPVDHRMSMFVANDSAPIKLKVVGHPMTHQRFLITTAFFTVPFFSFQMLLGSSGRDVGRYSVAPLRFQWPNSSLW